MLENAPRGLGKALGGARAGMDKIVYGSQDMAEAAETIAVSSAAFAEGASMPVRFTADGEKVSPPLQWTGVPEGAGSLLLLIEDADAPTPEPLVHCIAWDLSPRAGGLAEGELKGPGAEGREHDLGRNSFFKAQYLPPDPPPGHGPHRYVFQVYALNKRLDLEGAPGRGKVVEAMRGHVLAKGMLIGVYERR